MTTLKRTIKATLALVLVTTMIIGIVSTMVLGTDIGFFNNTEEVAETETPPVDDDNTGEPAVIVNLDLDLMETLDGDTIDDNEEYLNIESGNEPQDDEFEQLKPAADDFILSSQTSIVTFYVDNMLTNTINESNPEWPANPFKLNLTFKGWYDSQGTRHENNSNIYEDTRLDAVFTATVRFLVDGAAVETREINEGTTLDHPADPQGDSTREFVTWLSLGSGVVFPVTVTRNLDITALFRPIEPAPDPNLYEGYYWIAGAGGTVRDYTCNAGCGWNTGNQYSTNVKFLFHPTPLPSGVTQQFAYIIITCAKCGAVNNIVARSNGGASLSRAGAAPSGLNNVNLGGNQEVFITRTVTFLPGTEGFLVGKSTHTAIVGDPFVPAWEPTVLANNGWVFIGWQDEHTGILHGTDAAPFPSSMENRNYRYIAQYSNLDVVHIEATTASKIYDGTPLTAGYTISGLPTTYTIEGFTAEGTITDTGSISSSIEINKIVIKNTNGDDVTNEFIVTTHPGTLTVTPRQASVTAEDAWKLITTADPGFTVSIKGFVGNDAPQASQILVTRPGAGIDETIGNYPNALIIENNGFDNPNYIVTWNNGDFEIRNNPLLDGRIITVSGNSLTITYNGFSHAASGYTVKDMAALETLGFEVTAVATGISAIDVNTSGLPRLNEVPQSSVVVSLNGMDVTHLVEVQTLDGELIINPRAASVVADNNWKYIGEEDPEYTISFTGFIGGQEPSEEQFSLVRSNAGTEAAGNYIDVLTLTNIDYENTNYIVSLIDGDFEIRSNNPLFDGLKITVTGNSLTASYNSKEQTAEGYTVSGLKPGFNVSAVSSDPVAVNVTETITPLVNAVSSVVVTYNGVDVTKWVALEVINGSLQINPLPATVKVVDDWKYIGESDPSFKAITNGFLEGDDPTADQYTITRPGAGADETAGEYPDALIITNNSFNDTNYSVNWIQGSFTINPNNPIFDDLTIIVRGNSNVDAIYHGSFHYAHGYTVDIGYTVDDYAALQELGFEVTAVAIGVSATNVNTSDLPRLNVVPEETVIVKYNGLDVTDYVTFRTIDGELIISPRAITITASSNGREYNGSPLTDSRYLITDGILPISQTLDSVAVNGSQTNPGSSANVPNAAVITDAAGNDVTANYLITYINGTLTVTINETDIITITAASDEKAYDGAPLTNSGSTASALPAGVTRITATVEGLQTNVGSSANKVTAYTLWNGTENVTALFPAAILADGVLTVTTSAAPIEITAAGDSKEYDGSPLTNAGFSTTKLPAGVTEVRATVQGSQTDVGTSENVVTGHTLWNGTQEVTSFFTDVTYIEGALTVTVNATFELTITASSDNKVFDGTPLTSAGFGYNALPSGVTSITATVEGTQTDVGSSANTVTGYTLYNGSQDVTSFFSNVKFIDGTLTVKASSDEIIITAASDSKIYDGSSLTNDSFTTSALPAGVTRVTAAVDGSQTNVGTSANIVTVYTLWNGNQDVTAFFPEATLIDGTLTVSANAAVITLTAGSDSKEYDGQPLTNNSFIYDILPAGVTHMTATVEGSQTDVGTGANQITTYTLWNGEQNVTSFFTKVTLVDGDLTVRANTTVIMITAASNSKEYDSAPLKDAGYGYENLPAGVSRVSATVEGSQTDVGDSANTVTAYTLYNGTQDVTEFFPNVALINGKLTVTRSSTVIDITAASDSKEYDGFALTNNGYTTSDLPAGVTEVIATIAGSQTDVGGSANEITNYTLLNGEQDVTAYFMDANLIDGTLTVTQSSIVIDITAASSSKAYDGLSLTNSNYSTSTLPAGVTEVIATVEGSQTDVGQSANKVTGYILMNGEQDVTTYYAKANLIDGTLRVTASEAVITITAADDSKQYDGTPLSNAGYTTSDLPLGVTHVTATVKGSQTDAGSSNNEVTAYTLWNGEQDVTTYYMEAELVDGTLRVTQNVTVIEITAADDSKEYDGSPLSNAGYTTSDLPAGVTEIRATVEGSQTDVGSSANVVTKYALYNGTQDVTAFFTTAKLTSGILEVTVNQTVIVINAASDSKPYDGKALTNDSYTTSDLPLGVTHVTAIITGSQKDVGSSENLVVEYKFWNGEQDVTAYFVESILVPGTLVVTESAEELVIIADNDSKPYDGVALTNDGFTTPYLPLGVTEVRAVVEGSQTDVGSSSNKVISHTVWNGEQDVTAFFPSVTYVDGTLTVTTNATLINITADSDSKQYDGTPLTNDGYTTSKLPLGVTHVTAIVEGSQTDVGSSDNTVVEYRLFNGEQDVTEYFTNAVPVNGKLDVTVNTTVITITAADDSKEYDGTPLTNDEYTTSDLPLGVTHVTAIVEGSQTDVGSGANMITGYRYWNGDQDVTEYFVNANLLEGTLTIEANASFELTITAVSDEKEYNGTPLMNNGYGFNALPPGVTNITTTVEGSQTNVGESANTVTLYQLWNGSQDVTEFFTNITLIDGTLTVTTSPMTIILTIDSDSKVYDGTPLINSDYSHSALPQGVTNVTVVTSGSQTGIGTSENIAIEYKLWNGDQDVTEFYTEVQVTSGALTVTPRSLIITAGTSERMYNGMPLTDSSYDISAGTLSDGHTITYIDMSGSQTQAGTCENLASRALILDKAANDVTDNYEITYLPGTLTVTPLPESPAQDAPTTPAPAAPSVPSAPSAPSAPAAPYTPAASSAAPATLITVGTPAAPATLAQTEVAEITDEHKPAAAFMDIIANAIPLAARELNSWALWNLILSIAGAVIAIMMGLRILLKKRNDENGQKLERVYNIEVNEDEEETKKKRARKLMILAIPFLAIIAIIIFIITQDMSLPMIMVDWWTLAHAILFLGELLCYIFAYKAAKAEDEEDEEEFLVQNSTI